MDIRKIIAKLSLMGQHQAGIKDARNFAAMALKTKPSDLAKAMAGMSRIAEIHATETQSWIEPGQILSHRDGRFDACDLRHWVDIAKDAEVPAIPAVEILRFTQEEVSVASGRAPLSEAVMEKSAKRLRDTLRNMGVEQSDRPSDFHDNGKIAIDRNDLLERAANAADDLPNGWMVRHARVGASSLKSIMGTGLGMREPPEVRFSSDVEVGPGWLRIGNRRIIDFADHRVMQVGIASGPEIDQVWLARPWVMSSRLLEAEDPHRANSPIAGRGEWPAEWRVFIRQGEVIGVSSYYAWAGGQEPIDAKMALEAAELGRRMIAVMERQNIIPAFADLEFARSGPEESPARQAVETLFPRDAIACTLDFIETEDGLMLLEGGPPYTPIGGAFPCGFAGTRDTIGVALKTMPGIDLGNPKTWQETSREGCILTWEEAENLAATLHNSSTPK